MSTKNMASDFAMVRNARSLLLAKMYQNALLFVVPDFALLTPWIQKSFKIVENCTKWKNKYSPAPRILFPFCTPPNASTLLVAPLLISFGWTLTAYSLL